MTKPEDDKIAAEKSDEELDLSKDTLDDLNPQEESEDVKGGATMSYNNARC